MCLVSFLSGPHGNGHEDCPYKNSCDELSEVYIVLAQCMALGRVQSSFSIENEIRRVGEKLETLVWRVVARCLRKPEEFRIQFGLQICTKPQRQ